MPKWLFHIVSHTNLFLYQLKQTLMMELKAEKLSKCHILWFGCSVVVNCVWEKYLFLNSLNGNSLSNNCQFNKIKIVYSRKLHNKKMLSHTKKKKKKIKTNQTLVFIYFYFQHQNKRTWKYRKTNRPTERRTRQKQQQNDWLSNWTFFQTKMPVLFSISGASIHILFMFLIRPKMRVYMKLFFSFFFF